MTICYTISIIVSREHTVDLLMPRVSLFSNLQLLQFLWDPVSRTDLARVSEGEHKFKTPII
jgi:hypothetical protein